MWRDYRFIVACEIEFYLHGSQEHDLAPFWQELRARCEQACIGIFHIEKERGHEQHEIALVPADPEKAGNDCVQLKAMVNELAQAFFMHADFAAKPIASEPGSGLHIHVHLEDEQGANVFYKDDAQISDALKHAIGGLLHWMPEHMPIFAPHPESYARFAQPDAHTPTTISWGANNRTCAIRLPDAAKHHKRIEHRVAGADADPKQVIAAIMEAIRWGIEHRADPGAQIYGDARLPMYGLPKLPIAPPLPASSQS